MAVKSSHGRRPPGTSSGRPIPGTAAPTATGRVNTAARGPTANRPVTGMADGVNRPMTGIRGAGFPGTASGSRTAGMFDPLNQAARARGGSPGLDKSREETPEDKIKNLEKKVCTKKDTNFFFIVWSESLIKVVSHQIVLGF